MSIKSQPVRFFLLIFAVVAAVLAVLLWQGLGWQLQWAGLAGVNLAAFPIWAWDKAQSRRDGWRVPELALHLMAAIGATPASLLAMLAFRHKTRKPIFWTLYAIFLALQIAAFFYLEGRIRG